MFDSIPSVITCYLVQRIGYKRYLMWFRFQNKIDEFLLRAVALYVEFCFDNLFYLPYIFIPYMPFIGAG